jgi:hypothetical protein
MGSSLMLLAVDRARHALFAMLPCSLPRVVMLKPILCVKMFHARRILKAPALLREIAPVMLGTLVI